MSSCRSWKQRARRSERISPSLNADHLIFCVCRLIGSPAEAEIHVTYKHASDPLPVLLQANRTCANFCRSVAAPERLFTISLNPSRRLHGLAGNAFREISGRFVPAIMAQRGDTSQSRRVSTSVCTASQRNAKVSQMLAAHAATGRGIVR